MNRRQFLATGTAFGVTGLAGCTQDYKYEIADVEGMDDSDVFEDVEIRDESRGLEVYITSETTLEKGGDTIVGAVHCEGEHDTNPYENELETGTDMGYLPISCSDGDRFEMDVVIYDSTDQPIDNMTLTIDIIE